MCVAPITFLLVTHHFFAKSVSGAREHVRFSYHDANSLGGGGRGCRGGRGGGQVGNKVAIRMVGELDRRRRRRREGQEEGRRGRRRRRRGGGGGGGGEGGGGGQPY